MSDVMYAKEGTADGRYLPNLSKENFNCSQEADQRPKTLEQLVLKLISCA